MCSEGVGSLCNFILETKQESSYNEHSPPLMSATLGKLFVYFSYYQNCLHTHVMQFTTALDERKKTQIFKNRIYIYI